MRSATPKVLHPLCGRPMLLHVLDALAQLPLERVVVVVGRGAEARHQDGPGAARRRRARRVRRAAGATGHRATRSALRSPSSPFDLDGEDDLLVVYSDVPAAAARDAGAAGHRAPPADAAASMLTARVDDPTGYGRIVRDAPGPTSTASSSRPTPTEDELDDRRGQPVDLLLPPRAPRAGAPTAQPRERPGRVLPHRRRRGVARCRARGARGRGRRRHRGVRASTTGCSSRRPEADAAGADQRAVDAGGRHDGRPRAHLRGRHRRARARRPAPPRHDPRGAHGGRRGFGHRARQQLVDTIVGRGRGRPPDGRASRPRSATASTVGPFVSLRPGTRLAAGAHVGTFVEMKTTEIGEGAKVPHLSYVGDAEIGAGRQHRGRHHHRQLRRPRRSTAPKSAGACAHGSNTVLVAPVELGDDATTGAGAVVNRDVPPGALAKGVPAKIEEGWGARREDGASGSVAGGHDDTDPDPTAVCGPRRSSRRWSWSARSGSCSSPGGATTSSREEIAHVPRRPARRR